MKTLLLVSAVVVLVGRSTCSPPLRHQAPDMQHNLNAMYDLAGSCIDSHAEEFFVEDVSHLVEGKDKCGDRFFCKVDDILREEGNFCHGEVGERLERTLRMYNEGRHVQCNKLQRGTTGPRSQIEWSTLLKHLKRCVQHRNFIGTRM